MHKVVVTDDRYGNYSEEKSVLKELSVELIILAPESNREERIENLKIIQDADALLVNLFPMTKEIISGLNKCRIISRYGVGYDNVDINEATKKGIWVANVPDYSIEDVSDQALAFLMGCVRKVAYKDRMIRQGKWNLHNDQPIHRMKNKVLGIIGYGAIGKRFHEKIKGLGFSKILVSDPYIDKKIILENGAVPAEFEETLSNSDYISIHVPLDNSTKKMIGKKQLSFMKKNSIIINTSRGAVLDEQAVIEALINGWINGAGLDVFETEPLPLDSPLHNLDNVILADHTGWYSEESKVELKTKAAMNILAVLKGGKPIYQVNDI